MSKETKEKLTLLLQIHKDNNELVSLFNWTITSTADKIYWDLRYVKLTDESRRVIIDFVKDIKQIKLF